LESNWRWNVFEVGYWNGGIRFVARDLTPGFPPNAYIMWTELGTMQFRVTVAPGQLPVMFDFAFSTQTAPDNWWHAPVESD